MRSHQIARYMITAIVIMLVLVGIVMLYSTTYVSKGTDVISKQLFFVCVGSISVFAVYKIGYIRITNNSEKLYYFSLIPLVYLMISSCCHIEFPGVKSIKGAYRWIKITSQFSIQPSEFVKLTLVLYLSRYFSGRRARFVKTFKKGLVNPGIAVMVALALVFLGKDLSTTVILSMVAFATFFVAGVSTRYVLIGLVALFIGVGFLNLVAKYGEERADGNKSAVRVVALKTINKERIERLTNWKNPEATKLDGGYQLWRSLLALGTGGIHGNGLTQSRMKHNLLPEAHTDFIIAVIGEELGFIALCIIILLYVMFMLISFWIASMATDKAGTLLAFGIGIMIAVQSFVNISVVSGFFPTTGVTAPFISYGGSSILVSFIQFGLLLSIISQADPYGSYDCSITKAKKGNQ